MWLMIASGLFGLSVVMALAEVFEEWGAEQSMLFPTHTSEDRINLPGREWPHQWRSLDGLEWPSTGRYVLIFGAILLMSLFQ